MAGAGKGVKQIGEGRDRDPLWRTARRGCADPEELAVRSEVGHSVPHTPGCGGEINLRDAYVPLREGLHFEA